MLTVIVIQYYRSNDILAPKMVVGSKVLMERGGAFRGRRRRCVRYLGYNDIRQFINGRMTNGLGAIASCELIHMVEYGYHDNVGKLTEDHEGSLRFADHQGENAKASHHSLFFAITLPAPLDKIWGWERFTDSAASFLEGYEVLHGAGEFREDVVHG